MTGGLVHSIEEVDLGPGDYVECHDCEALYGSDAELEEMSDGGVIRCRECNRSGFIVHRLEIRERQRQRSIDERLPVPLNKDWFPTPRALFKYREEFGLSGIDILIIQALWMHAYEATSPIYPAQNRIAWLADCSRSTVDRSLKRLERLGLIERRPMRRLQGRFEGTIYDLSPLWEQLAARETVAKEG